VAVFILKRFIPLNRDKMALYEISPLFRKYILVAFFQLYYFQ